MADRTVAEKEKTCATVEGGEKVFINKKTDASVLCRSAENRSVPVPTEGVKATKIFHQGSRHRGGIGIPG